MSVERNLVTKYDLKFDSEGNLVTDSPTYWKVLWAVYQSGLLKHMLNKPDFAVHPIDNLVSHSKCMAALVISEKYKACGHLTDPKLLNKCDYVENREWELRMAKGRTLCQYKYLNME
jgi:hypothetical protein